MTVGNFLANKNMQQLYFSYVKNPGKEGEVPLPLEVTQVIEKPPTSGGVNPIGVNPLTPQQAQMI